MASAISLNDVARMLSTKGGDVSTIGGAIGCMTAMISGAARDKDNTTSNDIRKIKEFICGDGGNLSSMITRIQLAIAEQTTQVQQLIEGNKEKKLVKTDITKMIKSATSGLEKRLDNILDSLHMIAKNQGGSIKWGSTKKTKDSIEQFKASLNDKKKMKDSRIGKLVSMLTELKAISFKDLLTFKPKMKLLDKLNPQINSFAKSINEKNVAKVNDFLEKSPKMFENLRLSMKLAKRIKEKDLERFYKILGIDGKKKDPDRNTILGLIQSFADLDKNTLNKSKKNVAIVFGMVKDICFGIGLLVLFSPVILFAGLISKPLEWALFGFGKKGNGGIMGIFKKLAEKKEDIKEANKSIMWMSLGFVTLGAGLGLLFAFTKKISLYRLTKVAITTLVFTGITVLMGKLKDRIKEGAESMMWLALGVGTLGLGLGIMFGLTKGVDWEQMAIVGASIAGFGVIAALLGQLSEPIKEGAKSMMWLALGVGVLGIGLGLLYGLTKDVSWEQMAMIGVSILGLGVVTVVLGALNKSGLVMEGAIAMAVMGAALIPFGFAMKLLLGAVKGVKWSEFGILAASTLVLGGAVIGLGALMATGIGAIAWGLGLAAIAALGAALIPYGVGMKKVSDAAKKIDLNAIKNLANATKVVFDSLGDAVGRKKRRAAKKNADAIASIGKKLGKLGKALKLFNDVAPSSIDKTMDAVKKISDFFFGDGPNSMSSYSTNFFKRIKANADADTIGRISNIMDNLATGLKIFNDVAPNSIDKAMDAIGKIANYFFADNSPLNTSWRKRRKAKKGADAIGKISDCFSKIATGLKDFNDVAPKSIDKAKQAIGAIADYFFAENSPLNTSWKKRRKAKKGADAIGVIADSMYKVSQALKDFQEVGGKVVDRMLATIKKIADFFFSDEFRIGGSFGTFFLSTAVETITDAIVYFDEETKKVDNKKMDMNIASFKTLTKEVFGSWRKEYLNSAKEISNSMELLTDSFELGGRRFRKNVKVTTKLFKQMAKPSFVAAGSTLKSATEFVDSVNTVDMEKAESLTDMFKSFASLGKSGGLFSNFDKRVKQFTEACIELVNAINGNTEAINSSDEEVTVKDASGEEKTVKRKDAELMPKQMMLMNVEDLAMAIADQLNSLNVDCDANINLQINNESGNEWRITRM